MNHYGQHVAVSCMTELAEIFGKFSCSRIEVILHWNATFCWHNEVSESERGTDNNVSEGGFAG